MTIKYEPNAAAISWLSLSNALHERAMMEGSLFSVFNKEMGESITQTVNQAHFTETAAVNEARQQLVSGLGSVAGALGSLGALRYGQSQAEPYQTQAESLQNEADLQITAQKVGGNGGVAKPLLDNEGFAVVGNNDPAQEDGGPKALSKEEKRVAKDKQEKIKSLNDQATGTIQRWTSMSNLVNTFTQGAAGAVQYPFVTARGRANAAQALAGGVANMLNTETSQMASAISSCDSSMQGTNGVMSTIIQVSAVRG